jgi:hypothetical protein
MISKFENLNKLFEEIDGVLEKNVHFFIIGGAMLLYHNLKNVTKDVDIIVDDLTEFKESEKILKKLKFTTKIPTSEYKNIDISQIFIRDDFRIDLFNKTVCKGFSLSEGMKKRSQEILKLKKLTVSLCSKEDVFLFKTFTEREGDINDCIALSQLELKWSEILDEIKHQIKHSKKEIWITYIGERLDILEERGLEIPILKDINPLRDKYYEELDKELEKKHSSNK